MLTATSTVLNRKTSLERRMWPRHKPRHDLKCRLLRPGTSDSTAVRLRDISPSGVALIHNDPVLYGTVLGLTVELADGTAEFTLLVRVVRCSLLKPQKWLLGCMIDELPQSQAVSGD